MMFRNGKMRWRLFGGAVLAGAIFIGGRTSILDADLARTAYAQQDLLLERRLSQIEQRFSFIESRISRVEQSVRPPTFTPEIRPGSDPEIGLLRTQMEILRLRLAEVECGLAKLDERTLAPAAREARRKSVPAASDPCRMNANAPVQLSARQ